jgi:cyclic lactone autoinducer peptide
MKLRYWLMSLLATIAVVAASTGVQPASASAWYQPEVPPELRK